MEETKENVLKVHNTFLNQKVVIKACLGGIEGSGSVFKGTVTSYDDEFVCLDNTTFIVRKYILAIGIE